MTEEMYSIWLQSSTCSQNIFNFIEKYAKEENKDTFLPHVTLVSHLSLSYGDELPKSFDPGELNELIPITISFDTLSLYKTGPKVSEWMEITTQPLH